MRNQYARAVHCAWPTSRPGRGATARWMFEDEPRAVIFTPAMAPELSQARWCLLQLIDATNDLRQKVQYGRANAHAADRTSGN